MHSKNQASNKTAYMQSRQNFPVWLICLLLFAGLAVLSARLIPSFLSRNAAAASALPAQEVSRNSTDETSGAEARTGEPANAGAAGPEASDAADSAQVPADASDSLPEASSSVTAEAAEIIPDENTANPLTGDDEPDMGSASPEGGTSASDAVLTVSAEGYGIPEWGHIHQYQDGICTICGQAPEMYTGFLPHEFYEETEHAGTVELHKYEIPAYANGGYGTYNKCFNVYLPWNYDASKPYDVLMLVHGGGGDQDSWLNDVYSYKEEGIKMCGKVLLDNMFEKGICEPCIVICPVTEIPQCQGLTASTNQLQQELREYILPYVVEHYSTYAADSSISAIKAARDHFGLGGVSNGALFVYEGGMRYNFDLFGSYAAFSGNGEPWTTVTKIKQTDSFKNLSMNCYFTGAGTQNDWQQNYTQIGYEYFLEHLSYLQEGKNAWRVDVEGEHEWKVWFTDLFNALPLMFPS